MADAAPRGRGGFGSRGDRGGDRGRGRRGRGRRGGKQEEKEWQPVTKLGRLVKAGKITSMEQIYLHSLPVKEYQIVDFFLPKLKDEVMKVRHRHHPYQHHIREYTRRTLEEIAFSNAIGKGLALCDKQSAIAPFQDFAPIGGNAYNLIQTSV